MREILFRGKQLQGGKWIEGYFFKSDMNKRMLESGRATLIFTQDCDTFIYVPEHIDIFMIVASTVGQYTGLKDRNGTKIFEGDIVLDSESGYRFQMKWFEEHGCFGFANRAGSMEFEYADVFLEDMEIIGNIHDSPELLNG